MKGFLDGEQPEFTWAIGNSKPKRLYADMRPGDRVVVWTGHGRSPTCGLLGTASVSEVRGSAVVLTNAHVFSSAITPYPKQQPQETAEVRLLRDAFGEDFTPLGDVMRAVFGTKRTPPVTVAAVPASAFDAVVKAGG